MYFVLVPIFGALAFLSACFGGIWFLLQWLAATSPAEQTSAAAVGMAFAVIPYVVLRCAHIEAQRAHEKRLLASIERVAQWTKE